MKDLPYLAFKKLEVIQMIQIENQDGIWTELTYIDTKVICDNLLSKFRKDNAKILK